MAVKKTNTFDRDDSGEKYTHPERTCLKCIRLDICIKNKLYIPDLSCDFAKYGCRRFKRNN